MNASPALDQLIREKAAELSKFGQRVSRTRVIVEAPSQHHRHGQNVHVTVELSVPDHDIVVSRDPNRDDSHENAQVAIRDAFRTAKHELQRYLERTHDKSRHGASTPAHQ